MERVTDEELEVWKESCAIPLVKMLCENLIADRQRIKELERLSASQAEALDMSDRGAL